MFLIIINHFKNSSLCLVPDEVLSHRSPKFSTRHTASGVLTHVDGASVGAFGYLPQDIIGKPIMDFYHPEDMALLKEIYGTVMQKGKTAGASFCSQPYRFLIRNGNYIMLETEWTSFVNPWSRKLEFVNGHHRVLQGPKHCNIFTNSPDVSIKFADELLNIGKKIQDEILQMMTEPISRPTDTVKNQVSKRCQALASFMETLMNEVSQPELKLDLPQESELTASERDSVMLGEISPHHEYYDSKSSSETPPSYNQLNYNDNLQRFFNSRPSIFGSHDESMNVDGQDELCMRRRSILSPVQRFESGGSGDSGSAENCSSGSNMQMDSSATTTSNSGTGTSSDSFQPLLLTESLLVRHNDDMEKGMIKKHREARICNRTAGEKYKNEKSQDPLSGKAAVVLGLGVKRSSSRSWEDQIYKNPKHQNTGENQRFSKIPVAFLDTLEPTNQSADCVATDKPKEKANLYNSELWPPFSFGLTGQQPSATITKFAQSPGLYPAVYVMPTVQIGKLPQEYPGPPPNAQPFHMSRILYPPVVYPQVHQTKTLQTISPVLNLPAQLLTNTTTVNTFTVKTFDKIF